MKLLLVIFLLIPIGAQSQSRAMAYLTEQHDDPFTMVFYYSTLKMWLPEDDEELKDIIHDIEKIKFITIPKEDEISAEEVTTIKGLLLDQGYEEMMTIKGPTRNLLLYIHDKKGLFLLGSEGSDTFAVDVQGTIPVDKLLTLQSKIETLTADGSIIDSIKNFRSN